MLSKPLAPQNKALAADYTQVIFMRIPTVAIYTTLAIFASNLTLTAEAGSKSSVDAGSFIVSKNLAQPASVKSAASPANYIVQGMGPTLADIRGHWAQSFIEPLIAQGILQGFSDGNFRPDAFVNRAEFASMIERAFIGTGSPTRQGNIQFADVPTNYWAYQPIQKAYQRGFLPAEGGYFNPTQNLTRLQALVALVEGLNLQATTVNPTTLAQYFEDAGNIPAAVRPQVAAAIENRLVVNYPNLRRLNPNAAATRGEIAAFVHQALVATGQLAPISSNVTASRQQSSASQLPTFPPPPESLPPSYNTQLVSQADFGTNLSTPNRLQPNISASEAQEQDYLLGGGDRIQLSILNVPEYEGEYQVLVNGAVNLPLIGNVSVKGLTLDQAGELISVRYGSFIRQPIATVSLVAARPVKVAVSGEVNKPGSFTIPLTGSGTGQDGLQFPTLSKAVQLAGGITQASDLRNVIVRRPQLRGPDLLIGVDLWALLQEGDLRQDLSLQDGDTIFIPTSVSPNLAQGSRLAASTLSATKSQPLNIAVVGEVASPGSYTVTVSEEGEQPTLTKAIRVAGGLTQSADLRQVQIRRPTQAGGEQLIAVDLWQLLRSGDLRQDIILQQGDTIVIPTASAVNLAEAPQLAATNIAAKQTQPLNIAVVGEVTRPGSHLIEADETGQLPTITKALQTAGGITQMADIRQIQVRRITREGTEKTINVNLWELLQAGDLSQDAILQQGDTIIIPTATEIDSTEAPQLASASFSPTIIRVNVVGEVIEPGTLEVPPNTPLNQVILAAGGFNGRAKKGSVTLVRLNPNGTVSQRKIEVDFEQGINEASNPALQPNDVVIVGKSGLASFSDTADKILTPLRYIFPFLNLF